MEHAELNRSFEKSDLPDWYVNRREPVAQAGTLLGLLVILDAHSDIISDHSIDEDFGGFEGTVIPQGILKFMYIKIYFFVRVLNISHVKGKNLLSSKLIAYFQKKMILLI
jgi:hypothetical protein